jgi:hypothetical protein
MGKNLMGKNHVTKEHQEHQERPQRHQNQHRPP